MFVSEILWCMSLVSYCFWQQIHCDGCNYGQLSIFVTEMLSIHCPVWIPLVSGGEIHYFNVMIYISTQKEKKHFNMCFIPVKTSNSRYCQHLFLSKGNCPILKKYILFIVFLSSLNIVFYSCSSCVPKTQSFLLVWNAVTYIPFLCCMFIFSILSCCFWFLNFKMKGSCFLPVCFRWVTAATNNENNLIQLSSIVFTSKVGKSRINTQCDTNSIILRKVACYHFSSILLLTSSVCWFISLACVSLVFFLQQKRYLFTWI